LLLENGEEVVALAPPPGEGAFHTIQSIYPRVQKLIGFVKQL